MTDSRNERRERGSEARTPFDAEASASPRGRVWLAAVLLVLTVAGGVAAKMTTGTGPAVVPVRGTTFHGSGGGPVGLSARLDRSSVLQGSDGLVRMELVIRGEETGNVAEVRVPTDLVVVLDRSGSMGGEPIRHARGAVRELISQLGDGDRFSLIAYASGASTVIEMETADADARRRWRNVVSGIQPAGGTNMASGLDLATRAVARFRQPGRVPRVVLLSDGHANEGDHSYSGLLSRARRAVTGEYALSTVGVGQGFDEALMTGLADAGTGNFYYVQRSEELGEIFAAEFASARENVASALRMTIHPAPGVSVVDAAGYPLERSAGAVHFRPGALFAGQERRIWLSLRVPAHEVTGEESGLALGRFALAYRTGAGRGEVRLDESPVVAIVKSEEEFIANLDRDAWELAVVQEGLGELKQKVAEAVRAAKPDLALRSIEAFRAEQSALNAQIGSEMVDDALSRLDEIEQEVAAEAAAPSAAGRSRVSKKYLSDGYDQRRQGAKR